MHILVLSFCKIISYNNFFPQKLKGNQLSTQIIEHKSLVHPKSAHKKVNNQLF